MSKHIQTVPWYHKVIELREETLMRDRKGDRDNHHSQHSWIFGNAITHQHKDMMNKLFSLSRDFCNLVLLGKVGCRVSKQN